MPTDSATGGFTPINVEPRETSCNLSVPTADPQIAGFVQPMPMPITVSPINTVGEYA